MKPDWKVLNKAVLLSGLLSIDLNNIRVYIFHTKIILVNNSIN